jgi:hypothetical protein
MGFLHVVSHGIMVLLHCFVIHLRTHLELFLAI